MRTYFWLGLILVLTALQRGVFAWATIVLTGDAGSVGLMAQHILDGERPLFLYGFPYSGAFAAYVTALVFRLIGDSTAALFAVPVLFSVGWAAASFGLFRELFDERAGLAAALLVAVPDWITTHYSAIPDCSYTPLFFLGTSALWLVVRITTRDLSPGSLWAHVVGLGALAGLGLWTHFLMGVYLGAGGVLLLPFLLRERFAWPVVLPFAVGGLVMGVFLLPYLVSADPSGGATAVGIETRPTVLTLNARMLVERLLPMNAAWPDTTGMGRLRPVLWFAIGAGLVLWLVRVLTGADGRDRVNSLVPLLLVGVFLVLYLPHSMALKAEPRYTIVLWTALLSGMVAVPMSSLFWSLRVPASCLLAGWTLYNAAGWAVLSARRAPATAEQRSERAWLVERAREAGLTHVELVGDYDVAVQAQPLSFLSGNSIRFVAASNERRAGSAQESETASDRGFACPAAEVDAVTGALTALGATTRVETGKVFGLVQVLELVPRAKRSVPAHEMWMGLEHPVWGAGDHLRDRRRSTYVDGSAASPSRILIDLGRPRDVVGVSALPVRLTADILTQPGGYLVESSADGGAFTELLRIESTVGLSHFAGSRPYLGGDYGWWEAEFPPVTAQYLRVTPGAAKAAGWQIAEWLVFEAVPGETPRPEEDIRPLVDELQRHRITSTVADRWLSARLIEVYPACGAWPRHNDHLFLAGGQRTPPRRFQPAPGHALVVARAIADDAERVLHASYGPSFPLQRLDLPTYTLFCFDQSAPGPLFWTGYTVLRP